MNSSETLITKHIDTWTSAIKTKPSAGRGGGKKEEFYGIKKLHELILALAVKGLLVPQNPKDRSASELLQRVAYEKEMLIKSGTIKSEKGLSKITPEEKTTKVPSSWEWCRLGDITQIVRGITFPSNEKSKNAEAGRIACLRTSNVQESIEWDDLLFIREEFVRRDDQILLKDDIVMSMANSRELVGKVAIVQATPSHKTTFGGFLGVIRPMIVVPHFIMILLRSPRVRELMIESASQTTNIANISLGKLKPLALPLPPLAEQHRIVAKVDELMALCDQLEQQQEDSERTHGTLVQTLLDALTTASERDQFEETWQQIASNFDILFTTESSIDQLKQAILQLAVMGKLVEQDSSDEHASELLKRITTEAAGLIKEGKLKTQKRLSALTSGNEPFKIPENWIWTRLGSITRRIHYGYTAKADEELTEVRLLRITDIQDDKVNWTLVPGCEISPKEIEKYKLKNGDILIARTGGTVGKSFLVSDIELTSVFASYLIRLEKCTNMYAEYIKLFLGSEHYWQQLIEGARGAAQPNVNGQTLSAMTVPLPPLAEQHRIVAKVDKLIALCDHLKANIVAAQSTQLHLADSLVEAVTF